MVLAMFKLEIEKCKARSVQEIQKSNILYKKNSTPISRS
jgi:hypothetical protein